MMMMKMLRITMFTAFLTFDHGFVLHGSSLKRSSKSTNLIESHPDIIIVLCWRCLNAYQDPNYLRSLPRTLQQELNVCSGRQLVIIVRDILLVIINININIINITIFTIITTIIITLAMVIRLPSLSMICSCLHCWHQKR